MVFPLVLFCQWWKKKEIQSAIQEETQSLYTETATWKYNTQQDIWKHKLLTLTHVPLLIQPTIFLPLFFTKLPSCTTCIVSTPFQAKGEETRTQTRTFYIQKLHCLISSSRASFRFLHGRASFGLSIKF